MRHALAANDVPDDHPPVPHAGGRHAGASGEIHTLLSWLDALSDETVHAHADLAVLQGVAAATCAGSRSRRRATDASARPDQPMPANGAHDGMQAAFQAYLALNWGEPRDAIPLAEQALARDRRRPVVLSRLRAHPARPGAEPVRAAQETAARRCGSAFQLAQKLDNHLMTLDALSHLALLMYCAGTAARGDPALPQHARTLRRRPGRPQPVAGLAHIPLGIFFYENNDLESARYCLVTGIALCQQLGMVYFRLMGQRALAKLQYVERRARGRVEHAGRRARGRGAAGKPAPRPPRCRADRGAPAARGQRQRGRAHADGRAHAAGPAVRVRVAHAGATAARAASPEPRRDHARPAGAAGAQ